MRIGLLGCALICVACSGTLESNSGDDATAQPNDTGSTTDGTPTGQGDATVGFGDSGQGPGPVGNVDRSVVPADRRTVWNPGIPGGVPPDNADPQTFPEGVGPASVWATLQPSGADDTPAIQGALDAAGAAASKVQRYVVKLDPGTFETGNLTIPSYVILRGTLSPTGERLTVINRTSAGTTTQIWMGNGGNWGTVRNVVGAHPRGSETITVDDASDFQVGDILSIDQVRDGSQNGPAGGAAQYNAPAPGDWVWNNSSLWYQRQPYSTGHGTEWLFPDSAEWRVIHQIVEVIAKNGNVLTIFDPATGRGSPLHVDFYLSPQVYRLGGSGNVTRYAGIEDLMISPNGSNRIIGAHRAAFSWVRNVETDGTKNQWSGRHIQFYQTYRCEILSSYVHGSSNYFQGGNAYGITIQGSETHIADNVVRELNKPIELENTGGGNVIAYNYVDEAVIGDLTASWQEAAIGTHASFCHSDLIEGNHTPNIGMDSTHGNNGWYMIFRNYATARNSSGHATGYNRAIFSDGWNRELTTIGNVLGQPGITFNYGILSPDLGVNPVWNGPTSIYLMGSNAWELGTGASSGAEQWDDGQALSFLHRHLDYDYHSKSQYDNPANPVKDLPPSLYLSQKPAFFGSTPWPWIDPAGATHDDRVGTLPAKARYDNGTP